MSGIAVRLAPLLTELDTLCPVNGPVLIDEHLVPLFKKHAGLDSISFYPVPSTLVLGVHFSHPEIRSVTIAYRRCEAHFETDLEPTCPECQEARYRQAKELVHCFDSETEKTAPGEAAQKLIDQLVKGSWEGPEAIADGVGEYWGIELLARYRHRRFLLGDGTAGVKNIHLAMAEENKNFSRLASQYGVPQHLLAHAFSPGYMAAMRELRISVGIPVDPLSGWED